MTLVCNCALPSMDPTACSRCTVMHQHMIQRRNYTNNHSWDCREVYDFNRTHVDQWEEFINKLKESMKPIETPITFDPPV